MGKFMTIEDVARELHISLGTARNRVSRGEAMPPSIVVGRRRLFPVTEFDRWVSSLVSGPTEELPTEQKSKRGRPKITQRGSRKEKPVVSIRK